MIYNRVLFEEVWASSQDALEAFKSDAQGQPGYNEQLLQDAFIAGLVTAITVLGHKELRSAGGERRKKHGGRA